MNLQNIKNFIYNNIVYFALYNVLFTLVLLLFLYAGSAYETFDLLQYFKFDFLQLSYFKTRLFEIDRFNMASNILGLSEVFLPVFYIILTAAIILYFTSKKAEQRLLQFCTSIMFLSNLILLIVFFIALIGVYVKFGGDGFSDSIPLSYALSAFFQILKMLFTVVVCGIYLTESKKRMQFELLPEETPDVVFLKDGKYEIKFKRATKGTRFLHYIVDSILIVLIFSPILMVFMRGFARDIERAVGEELGLYLVLLIIGILYYLIFEGLFRMTPAKYLTSCAVTGYESVKVNGAQILGRAFCRKIPFEAFSFFGELGWHDQLPETIVTHYKSDNKTKNAVIVIMVLAAVAILIILLKNLFR